MKRIPTEIISKIRSLLNQTINEYRNQNFTGTQGLASSAYLDNFEFIETPLDKHDKALRNERENAKSAIKASDKAEITSRKSSAVNK